MKKAKSWLALPLAVCMLAVMIFSVAEAKETIYEIPAEGNHKITIINTNHITWPVIGEMPSYKLEVPAGAHYFINMAEWTTKDGETRLMETDRFEEGEYELYVTYEAKEGYEFAAPEQINVLPGNEVQGKPEVKASENGWYRIVKYSFKARQPGEHVHDILVVQEKLPTCTEDGYKACYKCQSCEKLYLDKEATQEVTAEEILLPATGHTFENGICTLCGETDPEYVKPHEHTMTAIPEKIPGCITAGNQAYFKCETCGKLYLDQEGIQEITVEDITLQPTGHTFKDGMCTSCGETDPEYVKPHEHTMTAIAEKNPTCTEAGNKAYFKCETCGKLYLDQNGIKETTAEAMTVKATGHQFKDGVCTVCKTKDPNYTAPHQHSLVQVPEKKPTCTTAGNKAHYRCETCKKRYLDKDAKNETTLEKVTIKALGHTYRNGKCTVCNALLPAVKTGDYGNDYAKWVIGLLISLNIIVGAIIYRKSKRIG